MIAKRIGVWLALTALTIAPSNAAGAPSIFVGGQFIRQTAIDDHGHLLVPIRGIFEALGASVIYAPPRIVVVRKNNIVVAGMVIGRRTAIVANRPRLLDVAPMRLAGRVYVPLRGIAELAGASVQYTSAPPMVDIRVPNNELTPALVQHALPDDDPDPVLPIWFDVLVGLLVVAFIIELGRRVAAAQRPRPRRQLMLPPSAMASARLALQLPNTARFRDEHEVGQIAKYSGIDDAVNRA